MIHILRSTKTKQFRKVVRAGNGEILDASEPMKQKQSVWKNIYATARAYNGSNYHVMDHTLKSETNIFLCNEGKIVQKMTKDLYLKLNKLKKKSTPEIQMMFTRPNPDF